MVETNVSVRRERKQERVLWVLMAPAWLRWNSAAAHWAAMHMVGGLVDAQCMYFCT